MTDREIDDILLRGADVSGDVDAALLDRISESIGRHVRPVRPLAPAWALASGLFLACATVAVTVAALLGLNGVRALGPAQIAFIFPVIGVLTWIVAMASVGEATPGRASGVSATSYPAAGSIAIAALFAALFHDYGVNHFVPRGIVCLTAGLATAIPTGIAASMLLRRGYAVNRRAAGLVIGTLAGLAGVAMLELHCANLQALHVLVWHTAVMPIAALAGSLLAIAGTVGKQS